MEGTQNVRRGPGNGKGGMGRGRAAVPKPNRQTNIEARTESKINMQPKKIVNVY